MAQEINLGGTIYVSSKKAAELTGYTQDYIGQLARGGSITAQRVSGLWYVVEESLRNYKSKADDFKPIPPQMREVHDIESTVSFDGKDYVSAQRAAKITGYHQDYVGQLARSGKILSRLVGSRWYVDREGIVEHKKYNDALLAAVQTDSVGLERTEQKTTEDANLHFSYIEPEKSPEIPEVEIIKSEEIAREIEQNDDVSPGMTEDVADEVNEIPIRVIRPRTIEKAPKPQQRFERSLSRYPASLPISLIVGITIVGLLAAGGAYLYKAGNPALNTLYGSLENTISRVPGSSYVKNSAPAKIIRSLTSKEIHFQRDSF